MASEQADNKVGEAEKMQQEASDSVVSVDLPAPVGWNKKFIPKKTGTPRRSEIVFISPSGEEIRTRKQLDKYLKSHPGGPSSSEFDWSTGDTPRRSTRLSSKSKATETPEKGSAEKKQRTSSSQKAVKEKKEDAEGEGEAEDAEAEVKKKDAENHNVEEKAAETATDVNAVKDSDQKTEDKVDEMAVDNPESQRVEDDALPPADKETATDVDAVKDSEQKTEDKVDEMTIDNPESHKVEDDALPRADEETATDVDAGKDSDQKAEDKVDEITVDNPESQKVEDDALPRADEGESDKSKPAEEKKDNSEVLQEVPVPEESVSSMEKDLKEAALEDTPAETQDFQEARSNQESSLSVEEETKHSTIEAAQKAVEQTENRPADHDQSPHGPNAPPVTC